MQKANARLHHVSSRGNMFHSSQPANGATVASFREDRSICGCANAHGIRRVVLTGGPGAGKTAVLELVKHSFCRHVMVLPESAGIVFGGGFPRRPDVASTQAAQRAIFHVQRELENAADGMNAAVILCDRGTVDG